MAELIADSRLADELAVGKGSIVAFVGGGGKTSLMFALARQLCGAGLRVLCTTTTKMMKPRVPEDCAAFILAESLQQAELEVASEMAKIENAPVLLAGGYDPTMPGNKRVVGIPATWPAQLLETGISCDVVLVEADGSRKLPFKAPQAGEPVLPLVGPAIEKVLVVVAVAGVDAVGRPVAEDFVCRAHCVSEATGIALGDELTAPAVAAVIGSTSLWGVPTASRLVACVNKVDDPHSEKATIARRIAEIAVETGATAGIVTGENVGQRGTVVTAYHTSG